MCYISLDLTATESVMSTTTIRLSDELKGRVAKAAKRTGTSTHGFILDAIVARTEAEEHRNAFFAEAQRRYEAFRQTGDSVPWDDVKDYMMRKAGGENPPRPIARKAGR